MGRLDNASRPSILVQWDKEEHTLEVCVGERENQDRFSLLTHSTVSKMGRREHVVTRLTLTESIQQF